MKFRCKICGAVYEDAESFEKGTHKINDVYGKTHTKKCVEDNIHIMPNGEPISESLLNPSQQPINSVTLEHPLNSIECDLDNVAYLYNDKYYGQFMQPGEADAQIKWNKIDDPKDSSLRFAHNVPCINSEEAKYKHAYNRAYLGVRPEYVRMPNYGVDALVTMTHWAYVDGLFSAGEIQIWIGKKGQGIDPTTDEPAIVIYGECEGDKFGIDVRSAGDFNGDGYEELVISAPFHGTQRDDGQINEAGGIVYLLFLGQLDLSHSPLKIRAEDIGVKYPGIRFEGGHDGSRYPGWGLTLDRCHFASNECSSIIIGSFDIYPWKRIQDGKVPPAFSPRAYIVHGSKNLPSHINRYRLGVDNDLFGIRVSTIDLQELLLIVGGMNMTMLGVGDFDNDGYEELSITLSDGTFGTSYIFYGSQERYLQYALTLSDADLIVQTKESYIFANGDVLEFRGLFSATSVNDFDGDGNGEILFTAPKTTFKSSNHHATQVGCVGVLRGGARKYGTIDFSDLDYIIHGEPGKTFALGKQNSCRSVDITNNGFADILINDTAYVENCCGRKIERGRFWLVEGGANKPRIMAVPRDAKITYLADLRVPGLFGYGWTIGDFDGDERYEIAIGDHYLGYRDGKRAVGGVYIFPSEKTSTVLEKSVSSSSAKNTYLVSATASDIVKDINQLELKNKPEYRIILDTRGKLLDGLYPVIDFFDYCIAPNNQKENEIDIQIGKSISKYGKLIEAAIKKLANKDSNEVVDFSKDQVGLANWIRNYIDLDLAGKAPFTKKEFLYFLCSSSQRSTLLVHILNYFFGDLEIPCLVDHGAGISMLSLCVKGGFSGEINCVACSEPNETYSAVGIDLWKATGWPNAIHYQKCSAVDFAYPNNTTVVFFGQMLFRIPAEKRPSLIDAAWEALSPNGVIIINELMNRTDAAASSNLLSSDDLISYLPRGSEQWLFVDFNNPKCIKLDEADRDIFRNSDNFIVVKKLSRPSYRVLSTTVLDYDSIILNGSETDRAYLTQKSNMDTFKESFIDYILKKRSNLFQGKGTLLDSGCGNGRFSEALSAYYRVTGEDLSPGGIYMALQSSKDKTLDIEYRLANSLEWDDMFDVVFLRGPSYLEGNHVDSDEFKSALKHMVSRCRNRLFYVSWSPQPFNRKNKFGCWSHYPDKIKSKFEVYGKVEMTYEDSYIVISLSKNHGQ